MWWWVTINPMTSTDTPDAVPFVLPAADGDTLTPAELAVLAFEREHHGSTGARWTAIRARFGWTPVRYSLFLHRLIGTRRALAHDPLTVNRLRRIVDARASAVHGRR